MIEQTTGEQQGVRLAPFLDRALDFICDRQLASGAAAKTYRITMVDAHRCSRLTQLYREVNLTKTHKVKILATSKCISADQELKARMPLVTELAGFDLKTGDPGIALLKHFMLQDDLIAETEGSNSIGFESIEEATDLFDTITDYSYLTKRRKKSGSEFKVAEERMRLLVEHYHLRGRFTWNQRVEKDGKIRTRPSTDFLNDY